MLINFLALFILGTAQGLSIWWVHALSAFLAIKGLRQVSHYYIFWLIFFLCIFCSTEPRFSIEYFLLKIGFLGLAFQENWRQEKQKSKKLFLIFITLGILEALGICYGERGGVLLWLSVFLALYFQNSYSNKVQKVFIYTSSFLLLLTQPKTSSLLSFIGITLTKVKSKIFFWSIIILSPLIYFSFFESYRHFLSKSLSSRIYIGGSCLKGFIDSPISGHGFGTFAMDIPAFRIIKNLWGSRGEQQLAHGHSIWGHYGFELGLIGILLLAIFFVLVFKHARPAFLPLVIISIFDCPLVSPQQFLLAGLIFYEPLKNSIKLWQLPSAKITKFIITIIAGFIFGISIIGHFYYDKANYERAIFWDRYNSLYYFMQGSYFLNKNTLISEKNFTEAVKLSPNIEYFYGYLSASLLANNKIDQAETAIKKALKTNNENAYWHVIMAFIKLAQGKNDLYQRHMSKATALNPYIPILLENPQYGSPDFIGSAKGDIRIISFYRKGEKLYLPLPYV